MAPYRQLQSTCCREPQRRSRLCGRSCVRVVADQGIDELDPVNGVGGGRWRFQRFQCEDCGHVFEELRVDVEDEPLSCPKCGGLDIQLMGDQSDQET